MDTATTLAQTVIKHSFLLSGRCKNIRVQGAAVRLAHACQGAASRWERLKITRSCIDNNQESIASYNGMQSATLDLS